MAARTTKGTKDNPWPEKTRQRIRAAALEIELIKHVGGKREMSSTQVRAALGLIAKVLPDQTENKTDLTGALTIQVVKPV